MITRGEIRAFGWRTLGEALASLPGVQTNCDHQYSHVGTRGFGLPGDMATRVLVTINGNRANDPVHDGAPTGRELPLDMDLVERIEFIPGPGAAVHGQNAMFGVVNVITRTGAEVDGTELAAAYQHPQSLREARASRGRRLDSGVDVLVSVSGLRARGEDRFFDYGTNGLAGVAAGLDAERDQELLPASRAGHGRSTRCTPSAARRIRRRPTPPIPWCPATTSAGRWRGQIPALLARRWTPGRAVVAVRTAAINRVGRTA